MPYRTGNLMQAERDRARIEGTMKAQAETDVENYPGAFGVDMAIWTSPSPASWSCMHTTGNYSFAIIEGFNGGRGVRSDMGSCTGNAWNAGFAHVDIYSFMCPGCGNSASSVSELVNTIRSQNARFGTIWLDIEDCSGCWGSTGDNVNFIQSLISEYQALGITIGIYTSQGEWSQVTGNTHNWANLPLWYAHYDGSPSFSDFYPGYIGGWQAPAMKQFADSAGNACGVSVDRNWYP
jgi:GH25 family lysozyme M1 (1,4-beta-N-acetylmuramidase)